MQYVNYCVANAILPWSCAQFAYGMGKLRDDEAHRSLLYLIKACYPCYPATFRYRDSFSYNVVEQRYEFMDGRVRLVRYNSLGDAYHIGAFDERDQWIPGTPLTD